MSTRALWIVACALAVLGGFVLVLRICWLLHFEENWLPYLAHGLGAVMAGGAMVRAAPVSSSRRAVIDGFAGGVVGIAILALIAFGMPRAFGWIGARSTMPALLVPAIALATGAATAAGAWLFRSDGSPLVAAIIVVDAAMTAFAILIGGRVAVSLGLPVDTTYVIIFSCVVAFASAFLTQTVVPATNPFACSAGVLVLVALELLEIAVKGRGMFDSSVWLLAVVWFAALAGASLARK